MLFKGKWKCYGTDVIPVQVRGLKDFSEQEFEVVF